MPGHLETARKQRADWESRNLDNKRLSQLENDYVLPKGVLAALAYTETGGQPKPQNPFQMKPVFLKEYGIKNRTDPEALAEVMRALLDKSRERYDDQNPLVNALMMYNNGPQSTDKILAGKTTNDTYGGGGLNYANRVLDAMKGRAIHYQTPDKQTDRLLSLQPDQRMLGMQKGGLVQMKGCHCGR